MDLRGEVVVIYLDGNGVKDFNDQTDHSYGNELIRLFAAATYRATACLWKSLTFSVRPLEEESLVEESPFLHSCPYCQEPWSVRATLSDHEMYATFGLGGDEFVCLVAGVSFKDESRIEAARLHFERCLNLTLANAVDRLKSNILDGGRSAVPDVKFGWEELFDKVSIAGGMAVVRGESFASEKVKDVTGPAEDTMYAAKRQMKRDLFERRRKKLTALPGASGPVEAPKVEVVRATVWLSKAREPYA
jgi:GGDEF domain-containing protein